MGFRRITFLIVICSLFTALAMGKGAWGDISVGSAARAMAMGGAGIALADDPSSDAVRNPAILAFGKGVSLRFPNFEFRHRGASLTDAIEQISEELHMESDEVEALARSFASQETWLCVNLEGGLRLGSIDVSGWGSGLLVIDPNEQLRAWGQTGAGDPPDGASANVRAGAILAYPSVAIATRVGESKDTALGVRVNMLHGKSFEQEITFHGAAAPTLSALQEFSEDDWSMDVGIFWQSKGSVATSFAIVTTNLRKPSLQGLDVDTVVDAGAAVRTKLGLLVAADLRNLTGAYGEKKELRVGAEWKIGGLALRAGMSSEGSGLSAGVGLGDLDLSYTPKSAFSAASTVHF